MKLKTFEEVAIVILIVLVIIALIGLLINKVFNKETEIIEPEDTTKNLFDAVEEGNLTKCDDLNPVKRKVCIRTITEQAGG